MEQLSHFFVDAVWALVAVLVFAAIGVYATIRWIIAKIWGAEQAVERGIKTAESEIQKRF